MKNFRRLLLCAALALLGTRVVPAQALQVSAWADRGDRQIVAILHNARLRAGETAQDVVAVLGNATVDGDVSDSAVAVLGDLEVSGNVGNSAVAVLGNVYVNGRIRQNVVAVLGNVTLGPQAVVEGQLVDVLGTAQRSPGAVVRGGTVHVLPGLFGNLGGRHGWIEQCLLYGRPLAPTLTIGWAWVFALAALALYLLLAALFRDGMQRCMQTLESHPGESVLTAIIVTLLIPVVLLALVITVIGIAVIPLFWIALICCGLFGRAVALGWLGARFVRLKHAGGEWAPVLDVLLGGIIVLALYMVPVLGFIVYLLIGIVGFGAVAYTLVLATRSRREADAAAAPPHRAAASASAASTPPPSQCGAAGPPPADEGGSSAAAAGAAPPASATELRSATAYPRAGFWIRMLALLIDLILVGFALSLLHGDHGSWVVIVLAAYGALMWKAKGTTVGGLVCDLKVVRVDGRPLDWSTAIVRALGCFLSLVVACLGFIWIAFDQEHQAWHDKIAGTIVVRVPKGAGLL